MFLQVMGYLNRWLQKSLPGKFKPESKFTYHTSTTNAVVDTVNFSLTTTGTPAANLGFGLTFDIEDAGGAEEQARLDFVLTTVTNGSEDCDWNFKSNVDGAIVQFAQFDASSRAFKVSPSYADDTQSLSAVQIKPAFTATQTNRSITGLEVSPRYSDAGGGTGGLICAKFDPVLKDATAGRTVGHVRSIEINFDLPNAGSAYTVTNDVSAIRIFPDFGSGHTFSGRRSILLLAAPNTSDWQYLLEAETNTNGWVVATAGTYSTADGYFLVRVHGTDRRVPFFNAVD